LFHSFIQAHSSHFIKGESFSLIHRRYGWTHAPSLGVSSVEPFLFVVVVNSVNENVRETHREEGGEGIKKRIREMVRETYLFLKDSSARAGPETKQAKQNQKKDKDKDKVSTHVPSAASAAILFNRSSPL